MGNYTSSSFAKMVVSLLDSLNICTFSCSLNTVNGRFTLATIELIDFIINENLLSTCGILFGFKNEDFLESVSCPLYFSYPCDLLGLKNIKLCSNIQTNNMDSKSATKYGLLNIIQVNCPVYSLILYNNYSNFTNQMDSQAITKIIINMLDSNNNLINFNAVDWNITLQINQFYKTEVENKKFQLSSIFDKFENKLLKEEEKIKNN